MTLQRGLAKILKNNIFCVFIITQLSFCIGQEAPSHALFFTTLPKAELHLHLGGSYPIDYLHSIATPAQRETLDRGLDRVCTGVAYQDVFFVFGVISQIVDTEKKVEDGVAALCRALKEDGVCYAEIRTGIKDLGNGYEDYLQAVLRGIAREIDDTFQAFLLLSVRRNSTLSYAQATIELALKYRDAGIVGLDISGNSLEGDVEEIIQEIVRAKKSGLYITLHLGESPDETDQLLLLETVEPDRIGHGVHIKPAAQQWIFEHKTPIEVCLKSSVCTQMVSKAADHPGLYYWLSENHPIIICTDDPLVFRTNLTQEYMLLHETGVVSLREIERLAQQSFDYAFMVNKNSINLNA